MVSNYHPQQEYKNQNLNWLEKTPDSYQNWVSNMSDQHKRKLLQQQGLDTPESVVYSFNNRGFRCAEFDSNDCFIALGCSFTMGLALPQNQIWPEILSQHVNLPVRNLGIAGGSMDTCFRMLHHWIAHLKPKFVALLRPQAARFEFYLGKNPSLFLPGDRDQHMIQTLWYAQDQNQQTNFLKNQLVIEQICNKYNVKLIYADVAMMIDLQQLIGQTSWSSGRDLLHPGHICHKKCATHFLNLLNQN